MRTIDDLPEEQIEVLKQLSRKSRLSRAELVRRTISEYIQRHHSQSPEDAFGVWGQQPRDSLDYQREMRDEWGSWPPAWH
ncbi:MAG: CopG family transcriptional regulator [Chromatocurvus sp.]